LNFTQNNSNLHINEYIKINQIANINSITFFNLKMEKSKKEERETKDSSIESYISITPSINSQALIVQSEEEKKVLLMSRSSASLSFDRNTGSTVSSTSSSIKQLNKCTSDISKNVLKLIDCEYFNPIDIILAEQHLSEDQSTSFLNKLKLPKDKDDEIKLGSENKAATGIMNRYVDLKPKYELIRSKKGEGKLKDEHTEIFKVTLNDDTKALIKGALKNCKILILKSQWILKSHKDVSILKLIKSKMRSIYRECYIGMTYGKMCRNLMKIIDARLKVQGEMIVFETLSEYGGQNLLQLAGKLDECEKIRIICQLISALEFMESEELSHFDLKPENIVWDSIKKICKIIDFGISISFAEGSKDIMESIGEYLDRFTGYTRFYSPPEILRFIKDKKKDGSVIFPQKVDAFCFGVTLAEFLLAGTINLYSINRDETPQKNEEFINIIEKNLLSATQKNWFSLVLKDF